MTPRRLRLHGFRTFADLTLDLPQGCVGVIGDNGAGKSSLVMAIEIALFGPHSRSLEPFLTTGSDDLVVEVELEHAGETYRIRRGFSAKGRGKSTVDFERLLETSSDYGHGLTASTATARSWEPLTGATAADTQTLIERTLGLTRETWRASAYLAQGDGSAFTAAQPKDRKRILTDALGLHLWDELLDLARAARRTAEARDGEITARLGILQEQADRAMEAEMSTKCATLELVGCEEDLGLQAATVLQIEERHQAAQAAATEYERRTADMATAERLLDAHQQLGRAADAARPLVEPLHAEITVLEQRARDLERLQADRVRYEAELHLADRARTEAETAAAKQADLRSRANRGQNEITALGDRIAVLLKAGEHAEKCQTCGQTLDAAATERTIETLTAQVDAETLAVGALLDEADAIEIPAVPDVDRTALDETVTQITALGNVPAELATARERLAGHERTIAATDTDEYRETDGRLNTELNKATVALASIDAPQPGVGDQLLAELQDARRRQTEISESRDGLRVDQARSQQVWDQAREAQAKVDEHAVERQQLAGTLAELTQLERAYGRDGVPAHIVENTALPSIEAEANRILSVLGGPVTRVELRTERALKSGDGTRDTLDVICLTDDGDRDYSTFSGGERTRVDLALRIALARLLASRRGAESKLLAIDEPDGLDSSGMAALVDVMRELEQAGTFDSLILVSHIPELRDAFDTTLTVQRNGRGSEVLVG